MHQRKARSIMKKTNQELLNLYFQSRASDAEVAELEKRMLADSDLRELYLQEAILETNLNSIALQVHWKESCPRFFQGNYKIQSSKLRL